MMLRRADSASVGDAHDQRALVSSPCSRSQPACMGDQLFHAGEAESLELNFGDGSQAINRQSDSRAHDGGLRKRRIDHLFFAELFQQPLSRSENAAVFSYVLAEDQNAAIFCHLLFESQIDGFHQRQFSHCQLPFSFPRPFSPRNDFICSLSSSGSSRKVWRKMSAGSGGGVASCSFTAASTCSRARATTLWP